MTPTSSNAAEMTEEEFALLVQNQEQAVNANEVLMATYITDEGYTFPDEYAGHYIEDNKLILVLTTDDDEIIQKYDELFADFDCIEYQYTDYSYNFLYELAHNAVNQLDSKYPITSYYVDVVENHGTVEVGNGQENAAAAEYGRQRNAAAGCIEFRAGVVYEPQTTYIRGGMQINNGSVSFSAGYAGVYNGKTAFLTCGHDNAPGMNIYVGENKSNLMGKVVYAQRIYGDFAIVESTGEYQVGPHSAGNANIAGVSLSPAVGTYLYKNGMATGTSYCKVTQINATEIRNNGTADYTVYNLTKAAMISGNSERGDSGGPYWTSNLFCGIHSAYNSSRGELLFTPAGVIAGQTGFVYP